MKGWITVRLDQIADVIDPHPSHRAPAESKDGIPFPGIGDFSVDGTIDQSACRRVDESVYEEHQKRYVVADGDLGFGRVASIGKVVRLRTDNLPYAVSPTLAIIKPRQIDNTYLQHFLQGPQLDEQIRALLTGTTRSSLGIALLRALQITFPGAPEQQQIGNILSTLDRAIEQTEALIAKQQRIKAGLMQDLLAKGIDEHGNIRAEATHAFRDSPLGRVPMEWNVQKLGEVAKQVTSGSRGWASYYSSEGAVFLRIGNLTREHINLRLDDLVFVQVPESSEGKRTSVREGDLLISITADLGIIGVIPTGFSEAYVNQHIALVRLDRDVVSPRFVGHLLNGATGISQIDKLNESGAKAGLNLPTVGKLLIVVPKINEQERIAEILDTADRRIERDKANLKKLAHQKAGLMHDLLTGERRVTPLLAPAATA